MKQGDFSEAIARMRAVDGRFPEDAYIFLREALDFTIKQLEKPLAGPGRHVSASELLEGIRQYALKEFGPMAFTVLAWWNIRRTEDLGDMVFNMVSQGLLGKTDEDRKDDFARGYDFETAFRKPFRPRAAAPVPGPGLTA